MPFPLEKEGEEVSREDAFFNHSKHESDFLLINSGSLCDVLPIKCNAKD